MDETIASFVIPPMTDLRTDDFDFELPEELIASRPAERRDDSRMLVINRAEQSITHAAFKDLNSFLSPSDLLVLNNTRVVRSRYFSDDQKIELVRVAKESATLWRCMVRPGKRMKIGREVTVGGITGVVTKIDEEGYRLIQWEKEIDEEKCGQLALPHYMQREAEDADFERYQTVYAQEEGAIAAPTAGLHFTPELLANINHTFLTLHVGVGTFRPVKADLVKDHEMHAEQFVLNEQAAQKINGAARVVGVGTTVTRVLEHLASVHNKGALTATEGATDIFLYPPYQPQIVDALLTNFHLPKSTLMMLVSTFAGRELIMEAYRQAVAEQYRFFSYGDCMLIL